MIRVGQMIGNRKVLYTWRRGPFTYVVGECQCEAKTRTIAAWGMLKKGIGLRCRKCWREAKKQPLDKAT